MADPCCPLARWFACSGTSRCRATGRPAAVGVSSPRCSWRVWSECFRGAAVFSCLFVLADVLSPSRIALRSRPLFCTPACSACTKPCCSQVLLTGCRAVLPPCAFMQPAGRQHSVGPAGGVTRSFGLPGLCHPRKSGRAPGRGAGRRPQAVAPVGQHQQQRRRRRSSSSECTFRSGSGHGSGWCTGVRCS